MAIYYLFFLNLFNPAIFNLIIMRINLPITRYFKTTYMRSLNFKNGCIAVFLVLANLFCIGTVYGQAIVQTDKLDYPPGDTVFITGSGWLPGELVKLQVTHVGEGDDTI